MNILLLGPNGQLGSDLRRAAEALETITIQPCPRTTLDVTDQDKITKVIMDSDADVVLNTTSYHKTDEVESNAGLAVQINAHGVAAMAKACQRSGKRFVTISTDYVFGADAKRDTPYRETDPTGPINVYGSTKVMGEALIQSIGGDYLIFRVASLFGITGPSGKGANFVEVMLRLARDNGAVKVVADQFMSPTHTLDAAEAILSALVARAPSGVYHCAGGGQASWYELAKTAIDMAGISADVTPIPATEYPTPAARPFYTVLDCQKLRLAASAPTDWNDGLKRYMTLKGHL